MRAFAWALGHGVKVVIKPNLTYHGCSGGQKARASRANIYFIILDQICLACQGIKSVINGIIFNKRLVDPIRSS